MNNDDLRRMTLARPFVAFSINTADGRSIRVTHPEQVAYYPGSSRALVALPADDYAILDVSLVTSLTSTSERGDGE